MTNYADYEFYLNTYKGGLDATSFHSLIAEATLIIKNNTNSNLHKYINTYEVKFTTCKVVDILHKKQINDTGVSSISIDGVSKTYNYSTKDYGKDLENAFSYLPNEITRYL